MAWEIRIVIVVELNWQCYLHCMKIKINGAKLENISLSITGNDMWNLGIIQDSDSRLKEMGSRR